MVDEKSVPESGSPEGASVWSESAADVGDVAAGSDAQEMADMAAEAAAIDEMGEEASVSDASSGGEAEAGSPGEPEEPSEPEELNEFGFRPDEMVQEDEEDEEDEAGGDVSPLEEYVDDEEKSPDEDQEMNWYILKVQVNRESSICAALMKRVKMAGYDSYFGDILVPTEDVREFTKSGKQRVVKRKLYPGYIVVRMVINDDTWFLVRETPGIGDFTGAAGKPAPLSQEEIDRIIATTRPPEDEEGDEPAIKTAIKFKEGDRVRVKEGYFQNYEGEVSNIDERNGRITVMINIFGRPNPVELDHWQVEDV